MRFSLFFVVASSLSLALALPLTFAPERRDDSSLSHVSRDLSVELPLLERDVDSTLIEKRADPKPGFHRVAVTGAKASPVAGHVDHRPANAKITFGSAAKAKLDELGLHGKARKSAKRYHKNIVKAEMKNHGAKTGRVFHLAHTGGNDPNEKNHLTVGLYNNKGDQIKSPWALKKEKETGQKTKGLFHMYPENHKNIKEPKSFTAAAEKSQARQKAEAEAALAASKAKEAELEKAKKARVDDQLKAGKDLSAEQKKAQRRAKKAKRTGIENVP